MRNILVTALVVVLGCGGASAPRDVSNASLRTTGARQATNVHAITEIEPAPAVRNLLAASDRTAEDRALDDRKQAADMLTYLAIAPGMRVAELGSGAGYMTELLGRAVGPNGRVYAQNAPRLVARTNIAKPWADRLARPVNAHIARVDRDFDAPLPPEARGLDVVYVAIYYRDLVPVGVDRDAMNHAVHLALRSGGRYVVLDRAPPEGASLADLHVLHSEESRNVRREVEAAGFVFQSEGRFLRTGTDPRDWNAVAADAPTPNESEDRFVLTFFKP